jgi:hypothetical protein
MTVNEQFNKIINELLEQKELPPVKERVQQVEELCEWYFSQTGRYPKPYQLYKLADYILLDDLRDKRKYKVRYKEYPFHSYTQTKLRNRYENIIGDDFLDFIKQKEIYQNPNAFKVRTRNKKE